MRRRCSKVVKNYKMIAMVQQDISKRLLSRLDLLPIQPKQVIGLNIQLNTHLMELVKLYPEATLWIIDNNQAIVEAVPEHYHPLSIQYLCMDAETLAFKDQSIDLVIAHLTFHNYKAPLQWLASCLRVLKPNGVLLFSTYGADTWWELRQSLQAAEIPIDMPSFLSMIDVGNLLLQSQFRNPVVDRDYLTVSYRDLKQFFKQMEPLGITDADQSQIKDLTFSPHWQSMLDAYQRFYKPQTGYSVTHEVIYGCALGNALVNKASEIRVPIAQLKRPY